MAYDSVQCIGYQIYTGPALKPARSYVGLNSDADDVKARIGLMSEAIATAVAAKETLQSDAATLKVFMAPEFYFRGMRGAYELSTYDQLLSGVTALVADPKFADWLFVFGTAVARSCNDSGESEAYNVAIVQRGGFSTEAERLAKCVVIMKELQSDIDFLALSAAGLTTDEVRYLPAMAPASYALELNNPGVSVGGGYNGGGIFMLDGITFGLEVCLDHAAERLVNAWPGVGDFRIQIQLIPSGGMTIHSGSVAVLSDGLIFNVDGLTTAMAGAAVPEAYGYHSELMVSAELRPESMRALSTVTPLATPDAHASLTSVQAVFYLPPDNNLGSPTLAKPKLAIYSKQSIPKPEQVARVAASSST